MDPCLSDEERNILMEHQVVLGSRDANVSSVQAMVQFVSDISQALSPSASLKQMHSIELKSELVRFGKPFIRYNIGADGTNHRIEFISPLDDSDPPSFDISQCNLSDDDVMFYVSKFSALGEFHVRGNQVSDECLARILQQSGRKTLTSIDVGCNPPLTKNTIVFIGTYTVFA